MYAGLTTVFDTLPVLFCINDFIQAFSVLKYALLDFYISYNSPAGASDAPCTRSLHVVGDGRARERAEHLRERTEMLGPTRFTSFTAPPRKFPRGKTYLSVTRKRFRSISNDIRFM
jgi:hypothetical protein